jgi:hypothetical membrane protein
MTTLTAIQSRAAVRPGLRLAGVLLFILAALFMTMLMVATSLAPGFDVRGGAISDLGTLPETATLFNLSLVAIGFLNVVAGVLLFQAFGRAWILVVFGLAGIGAAGAGVFPLNSSDLHGLFALAAFLLFNVQALASASLVSGPMRWISMAAGIVGLVYVGIMVIGDMGNPAVFGAIGHGGAERMIVYPSMLWLLAFGGYLTARQENEPA